jgi:DNA-binding NtrC family response regulator
MSSGGRLSVDPIPEPTPSSAVVVPFRKAALEFERRVFTEALAATGGNVPRAARLLRLPESTFRYRAGKLSLVEGIPAKSTSPQVKSGSDRST